MHCIAFQCYDHGCDGGGEAEPRVVSFCSQLVALVTDVTFAAVSSSVSADVVALFPNSMILKDPL